MVADALALAAGLVALMLAPESAPFADRPDCVPSGADAVDCAPALALPRAAEPLALPAPATPATPATPAVPALVPAPGILVAVPAVACADCAD